MIFIAHSLGGIVLKSVSRYKSFTDYDILNLKTGPPLINQSD
jgi:hypothetical protein